MTVSIRLESVPDSSVSYLFVLYTCGRDLLGDETTETLIGIGSSLSLIREKYEISPTGAVNSGVPAISDK